MKTIRIAAVALEDRAYPTLDAKLQEAARHLRYAAALGAELAVLPETINVYGEHTPTHLTAGPMHLENWREPCRLLIALAAELKMALTIPVLHRAEDGCIYNSFFLIDENGELNGEYRKQFLTPLEVDRGVRPGRNRLLEWRGIAIGGGICFDTLYAETYERQDGMKLMLCPSRWPGGCQLDFYAGTMDFNAVLAYSHWSRIIGSDGRELAAGGYRHETLRYGFGSPVVCAEINFDRRNYFGNINQERMVEIAARYGSRVGIVFDQPNCLWTLESRSPEFTVDDLEREYGLVDRRTYLAASRKKMEDSR